MRLCALHMLVADVVVVVVVVVVVILLVVHRGAAGDCTIRAPNIIISTYSASLAATACRRRSRGLEAIRVNIVVTLVVVHIAHHAVTHHSMPTGSTSTSTSTNISDGGPMAIFDLDIALDLVRTTAGSPGPASTLTDLGYKRYTVR